jgi:hypothetical protein
VRKDARHVPAVIPGQRLLFGVGSADVSDIVLTAAAFGLSPGVAFAADILETLESLFAQGLALAQAGYRKAPVLMLVLSALLVLPLVALISFAVQRAARRRAGEAALRAAQRRARAVGDWTGEDVSGTTIAALPTQAWLTIVGQRDGTVPLAGRTIRIGRHADNDVRLTDSSVHRYHAVIERTPEEAFIITDVSGKDGNGMRINGERKAKGQLADGDLIELGRAKLRFENAPP